MSALDFEFNIRPSGPGILFKIQGLNCFLYGCGEFPFTVQALENMVQGFGSRSSDTESMKLRLDRLMQTTDSEPQALSSKP